MDFGKISVASGVSRFSYAPHGWAPARRSACAARRCESAVSATPLAARLDLAPPANVHVALEATIWAPWRRASP
jgi:hypothetical protein